MSEYRIPSDAEIALVLTIAKGSKYFSLVKEQLISARVAEMTDGGMGSLLFFRENSEPGLGCVVGNIVFPDVDGIGVDATLSIDKEDKLFELDLWKYDYSPLICLPNFMKLEAAYTRIS